MFDEMYCNLCMDKRHAEAKVMEVRSIATSLKQYVKEETAYDSKINPECYVVNDTHHIHFMCGICRGVSTLDLQHADTSVHNAVFSICQNIRSGLINIREYHEILQLLAGEYPICYRTVEKVWNFSNKGGN